MTILCIDIFLTLINHLISSYFHECLFYGQLYKY